MALALMPVTCEPNLCELQLVLETLAFVSLALVSLTLARMARRSPDGPNPWSQALVTCERMAFVSQASVSLPW